MITQWCIKIEIKGKTLTEKMKRSPDERHKQIKRAHGNFINALSILINYRTPQWCSINYHG